MRLLFFLMLTVAAHAANPAFQDFNTNQFTTAGNKVTINTGWTNDNGVLHPIGMTNEVQFGTVTPGWGILYSVYDGGNLQFVTNGTQVFFIDSGMVAVEFDEFSFDNQTTVFEGGIGSGFFERATNCIWSVAAGVSSASFRRILRGVISTDTGSFVASTQERSADTRTEATHGAIVTSFINASSNINVDVDHGAHAVADIDSATNCTFTIPSGAVAMFYAHNGFNMNGFASAGSFAGGALLSNNEQIWSEGGAVGAFAFGRDVTSTNNWTFGIHYTNAIPLSLAYGVNGATQFGITSNGVASVRGGLKVGVANQATITNILSGSATLNFASQSVGGSEDLAITVTGAKDGDAVSLGYESAVATGIIGSFSAWASNGVVFVRFIATGATQNPASGVFKVVVTEF